MSAISVIIPFYNVEKYIEKCLQSVSEQTFGDFEVILVDDGSTDNSPFVCRKFVEKDSRFKLFTKRNEGVSVARNFGIEKATGDFIAFIDSDDIVHPKLLETLITNSQKNNADIAVGKSVTFVDECDMRQPEHTVVRTLTPAQAISDALYQKSINNAVWGKLFRKSLFEGISFPENRIYEDLAVFYLLFERANRIVTTTEHLYFYRKREGSYIQRFTPQRTDVLDITDQLCEYMKTHHPSLVAPANDRKLSANFNILWLSNINNMHNEDTTKRCWKNIKELRWASLLNPNVRIKNKLGVLVSFFGLKFTIFIANRFKA